MCPELFGRVCSDLSKPKYGEGSVGLKKSCRLLLSWKVGSVHGRIFCGSGVFGAHQDATLDIAGGRAAVVIVRLPAWRSFLCKCGRSTLFGTSIFVDRSPTLQEQGTKGIHGIFISSSRERESGWVIAWKLHHRVVAFPPGSSPPSLTPKGARRVIGAPAKRVQETISRCFHVSVLGSVVRAS